MLESESRRRSVTLTQWAAIADPYSHTITGWAGIAISHLSAHLTQRTAEYGNVALCVCGLPFARRVSPLTLEPYTIEQTGLTSFGILTTGHKGSAQKPNYSDWIWLPSHIRTDSPAVSQAACQPCAVKSKRTGKIFEVSL